MSSPQLPKYQAIYASLRQQILDGDLEPGERLPPQQDLADSFGVTLMTLRQAIASLEGDGLVRAERGNGTFVAERPVDIRLGNLSSFAQQMRSAGVDVSTEVLDIGLVSGVDNAAAATALSADELACVTRRRSVAGTPLSLQRSTMERGIVDLSPSTEFVGDSLYDTIEAATGWVVTEARESITAVSVSQSDAALLDVDALDPALLSIRTSINQFGRPFLYDEALLVPGRAFLTADRTTDRLSLNFGISAK